MSDALTIENLVNLGVLIFLQAVLGFDNLLYVSIESKRAPEADQARVRRIGILIAIALRVILLGVVLVLLDSFVEPFFEFLCHYVFQAILSGTSIITESRCH